MGVAWADEVDEKVPGPGAYSLPGTELLGLKRSVHSRMLLGFTMLLGWHQHACASNAFLQVPFL
jgi:hypothetical protein